MKNIKKLDINKQKDEFEMFKSKVNEILKLKKTFHNKIKFIGDIIRLHAIDRKEFKYIDWSFRKILRIYKENDRVFPPYIPKYILESDEYDISDRYISLIVAIINGIYPEEAYPQFLKN